MKIAIPNHNKMDVYSHGEKLIHRDLNVKAPTNFSIAPAHAKKILNNRK